MAAEHAGIICEALWWTERPAWPDLVAGARPPEPPLTDEPLLGEWQHGWQYHASSAIERTAHAHLLRELALPSRRRNAISAGKSRVYSSMGRFASGWLLVCPTSDGLVFDSGALQCAIRRRLGIAVTYDTPDPHGHAVLATVLGGGTHARHTDMIATWRQILIEAGSSIPLRNVERVLNSTHIPVPTHDLRRIDIIAPSRNVAQGLPLFCDVTIISPIAGNGTPRPGTSNYGGRLLELAERENNATYPEVVSSGLGSLQCLGAEVYGRLGKQAAELLPALARERTRGANARIRKGYALGLLHRWAGLLGVALQNAVARTVQSPAGDLPRTQLEPAKLFADLEIV